jgi:dTDP-glucose pyrophosphorylase
MKGIILAGGSGTQFKTGHFSDELNKWCLVYDKPNDLLSIVWWWQELMKY